MKLKLIFSQIKIQKNLELFFVLLLILITIAITQIYNASREISKKEYINLINNLYFQKTVNRIFDQNVCKFLNVLSEEILKDQGARKYVDLVTFAFWIRVQIVVKSKPLTFMW